MQAGKTKESKDMNLTSEQLREIEIDVERKIDSGITPKILYKYRMWDDEENDNILNILQIRLSSPFELNADYPETILPVDESVITEEYKTRVALHQAQKMYPNSPYPLQLFNAYQLRDKMTIDIKEEREWAYQQSRIRNNEVRGVFCATPFYQHMDQWVHLAGNATGYVVGLDTKSVYMNANVLGSAGYVEYYDESNPPKVPPYSFTDEESHRNLFMELYNVPDRYTYEREYRIVRTNHRYDKTGRVAKYTEAERMIQLKPDDYKEILLGVEISEGDKLEIIQVRDKNLKETPIYQTEYVDNIVIKGDQL